MLARHLHTGLTAHSSQSRRNSRSAAYCAECLGWFPSSCLGTLSLQAPACSLTVPRGSWSFKDRIPKRELGNEQNLMNDNELLIG